MYKFLIGILLFLTTSSIIAQEKCPSFTKEQENLVVAAYMHGYEQDLGYSLAAIVWKESFVGKYVVRVNNDQHNDSYGITHIELKTAMYLLGINNIWEAKDTIVRKLMVDDNFAMDLALAKLKSLKSFSWKKKVQKYNGVGYKYGEDIARKVKTLKRCYNFQVSEIWS
jgi:hypothetical protein